MPSTPTGGSWNKYQKLVLYRLDEQDKKLDTIGDKVENLQYFKMRVIGWSAGLSAVAAAGMAYLWR